MDNLNAITLLGCAWTQVPLVFDIAFETLGIMDFRILKNMPVVDGPERNMLMEQYRYSVHEPGEPVDLGGAPLVFGVTGPKAKYLVYHYFKDKLGIGYGDFINIIHPTSYLATSCKLHEGIFIEPKVIISTMAEIRKGVTLKRGVSVGHNSVVGEYTEINPGVTISGHTTIGQGCIIGLGAVLKNQVTIGENTFIGMGSVVTGDIPANVIAYGNPCKVIRENTQWKI